MTIEFSLRQRAHQARWNAITWLILSVTILIGSYLSLPSIAGRTLNYVNQVESPGAGNFDLASPTSEKATFIHLHTFALIILVLCVAVISLASYLLARTAFIEFDSAARFIGLADAICVSGEDIEDLQAAASLFVPTTKSFPEISEKSLKALLEAAKDTQEK
ncbi:MAG: hypothetical protein WDM80_04920 [Limisphaerales bacterium]